MTHALPRPVQRSSRIRTPDRPRTNEETITDWALAAGEGDADAVERFVGALHRDIWRYLAYLSGDPQSADDLTQETFLRALGSLPRFEGRSSARTWLQSIARRSFIDSLRYAAVRPVVSDEVDWCVAAENARPQGVPGFEEGVALAELLASIPTERHDAFMLTQLLGLPYEEAAQVIGCPVGTVRSRVSRARGHLIGMLTAAERSAAERKGPSHRPSVPDLTEAAA
ncbi:sigma-70 family RNA polymerase sigma factor [Streptomyces scopuliridis]|uniref:Sigma-70 family RNA polymerase sigma factor n=1 Tax=Streptomyces scopuliridis TaxID=452529 RepID=A0ACD4ZKH0_9ACTN|nr:sigma-70 family RNA polymerase sigma factor [Streptomyces scopuliridis]WSB34557.1 sigma-70 family RNA polymerase sigma factor [Streptomyces scopuliridis]WSB98802.1 sigma-70 family RNA polymerase sigma factor [Streptomyces scopuliridis]WSC07495.1 sigma-70 family RNA polymerase sigma factor [Streptomyces scopuliridis]